MRSAYLHVVARPELRIGEHLEGLDQLPEPVRVSALRVVGVVALGQVPEDTLDGVLVGARGDLEGFVVVAGERVGHGAPLSGRSDGQRSTVGRSEGRQGMGRPDTRR